MTMGKRQFLFASIAALTIVAFLAGLMSPAALGDERAIPDFTKGDTIPDGAPHDWNLGPTGARGWIYCDKMETSDARQVCITKVEKGSPADSVLEKGDVILGAAGKLFSYDPRTEIGKAITQAEAGSGALSLIRWREGKKRKVSLRLPTLGSYSATAPFECAKSKKIFEQGCEALAERMKENPDKGNPIERSLNALALLSSGKREYWPLVKKQVEWASKFSDLERRMLHSWWYGFVNMLVAEYTMATGDRSFMPDLERITMEIVNGQSVVGSWGHRFIQSHNGRLAGYGMMNAPGLPLTVSLILAREAGVSDPALDKAIEKSAFLIRFYVGKGSVPYGDHHPWIEMHEDNGKNGIAALMFNLLGDAQASEYFSRMCVASHGAERDTGHTGNFFNMLWAMPGVALSGPRATGAWMEEFCWYYDLARRWDGTYIHQGAPEKKHDSYKGWDCTGAYLLAYGLPLKKILLTGRESIIPQVDAAEAERLIDDGHGWSPKHKITAYSSRGDVEIFRGLMNWSPVVRERSATELANREGDPTRRLIRMLQAPDLYTRLGGCQALIMLKKRAAPAVRALEKTLNAEDLWLRIKAAEALAGIGPAAFSTVPDLLGMLARSPSKSDPRGMQQRYLCFALFNRRDGMLGRSLDGVDREALYAAVLAGLQNEDGRARGSIESVYKNLAFDEIEPILPAIYQAVIEPAPSGIMFADGIRLSGLEILAKHRIEEGLPLCISLIDPDRWGMGNRIKRCLNVLRVYGGAARTQIPRIRELEKALPAKNWKPDKIEELDLSGIIKEIEDDRDPPALRSLNLPKGQDEAGARAAPPEKDAIKVFILAGQSNMEGAGAIKGNVERNGGKGGLDHLVKDPATADRFKHLVDAKGDWVVRDDVRIWYFDRKGGLTVGYGARKDRIGPELQFGHVVGDHFDEQVLLIKVAWGGKSLAKDFRPPSSGGEGGPFYKELFQHVRDVLANLGTHFPEYDGRGYEIVGFGWHQGWNDRVNQAFNDAYETNLANFIRDVRKELAIEDLPFVLAETGMSGHEEKHPRALSLMRAQAAVAEYEEFKGNVAFVGTKDFYRPPEESPSKQSYHWNSNAETYFLIGDGMGRAMIKLIEVTIAK